MRKNKKKVSLNFNTILLIVIPLVVIGGALAKYIYQNSNDALYEARAFYFESDLLSDNTSPKLYKFQTGQDSISFELRNNIDDLRWSDVDIEFVVSISDTQGKEVKDKNGQAVQSITKKLSNKAISKQNIEFTNLNAGSYVVEAKTTKPYEKILQATFVLTEKNDYINYRVNDSQNSPVTQLTIITEDYSGNIKITWPEGLAPDNTQQMLSYITSGYNGGNITINFKANSEYTFTFFKKQSEKIYTKNDFLVEK